MTAHATLDAVLVLLLLVVLLCGGAWGWPW